MEGKMTGVLTLGELVQFLPKCAACGEPLPIANGRVLWEYWGLDSYPDNVKKTAQEMVRKLEDKRLCWSCVVKSLVLFSAFLQANGELDEVGLALSGGGDDGQVG